jgi:hypothetical protein
MQFKTSDSSFMAFSVFSNSIAMFMLDKDVR